MCYLICFFYLWSFVFGGEYFQVYCVGLLLEKGVKIEIKYQLKVFLYAEVKGGQI